MGPLRRRKTTVTLAVAPHLFEGQSGAGGGRRMSTSRRERPGSAATLRARPTGGTRWTSRSLPPARPRSGRATGATRTRSGSTPTV